MSTLSESEYSQSTRTQPQPIRVTNISPHIQSNTAPSLNMIHHFTNPMNNKNTTSDPQEVVPSDKAVCGLILKNWKSRHSTKTLIRKAFHVQDFESSIPHNVLLMAAQELSSVVSAPSRNGVASMISKKPHMMKHHHLNKTKQGKQTSSSSAMSSNRTGGSSKLKFHQYQPSQQGFPISSHPSVESMKMITTGHHSMHVMDGTNESIVVINNPSTTTSTTTTTTTTDQQHKSSSSSSMLNHSTLNPNNNNKSTTSSSLIFIEKQVPFKFATLPHQSAPSMKKPLSPLPSPRSSLHPSSSPNMMPNGLNQSVTVSSPLVPSSNWIQSSSPVLKDQHHPHSFQHDQGDSTAFQSSFSLPPLLFVHSSNNNNNYNHHSERTLPSFSQLINQLGV
ncbi:hypothetical protein FDP41_011929 [Naegleria fowleri]|uniref:Uncharacterized protein n=1 Tax=Naegleria fowleri TaxID=5763 RepID=A0A6A5C8J6_NAEFO|nr:uncharacterized protein FDP41_011929 [Naegleria fowleri]KAF0982068.1 hypothetical protein FDP41_011929 [Naegleria fowleri]